MDYLFDVLIVMIYQHHQHLNQIGPSKLKLTLYIPSSTFLPLPLLPQPIKNIKILPDAHPNQLSMLNKQPLPKPILLINSITFNLCYFSISLTNK